MGWDQISFRSIVVVSKPDKPHVDKLTAGTSDFPAQLEALNAMVGNW